MLERGKNRIEDIKQKLYDPNNNSVNHPNEGVLHKINYHTRDEWIEDKEIDDDKKNIGHFSFFKKFFMISVIFFISALGFAFYKFSNDNITISNDKIDIKVIGSSFTKGGEDLPLQIEITNNNNASLELANLIIEYPKGSLDNIIDIIRLPKDSIGTINPGENVIRNINIKLYGEEKSIRELKISLEYHPENSNAIFSKNIIYPVTISLSPLSLDIKSVDNIASNQPITINIKATLNTSLPDENPILKLTYPNNFIFDSALPSPSYDNSTWDISGLTIDKPMDIEIKGHIIGEPGEEQVIHAYAGIPDSINRSELSTTYSSVLQKISIIKPFLDVNILVSGQDKKENIISSGVEIPIEIDWSNNLSTRIIDAEIIANLSGNVFNENFIRVSNGYYNSINDQIIWNKNQVEKLGEINPGEKGSVHFTIKSASLIGVTDIKNPELSIKVSIRGREPLSGSSFNDINNFSEKILKVLSNFQISSSASYQSGSVPPKAETETKYLITWTLSNTSNSIKQAEASATLPIYIKWIGKVTGENENISYNEVTHNVIWNIGQAESNLGLFSNREASFIVSINPSKSQIGSIPQLTDETKLSGIDTFTNTLINSKYPSITTDIKDYVNTSEDNGRVVE